MLGSMGRSTGTALVWVVWPSQRQVDVWRPGDTQPSVILGVGDTLAGDPVVPGFSCPVTDLFR